MSHKLISSFTFFGVISTAMLLSAQPTAPPPNPPARDREPHYRSKPQSQFPRTNRPNLNILADESIPPVSQDEDDDAVPAKRSEIKSTVSTPRTVRGYVVPRPARTDVRSPMSDTVLATTIALANHEAIQLSEFASKRAQNLEVQKFAALISHDHRAFLKKLQVFAPDAVKPEYIESVVSTARKVPAVTAAVKPVVALVNDDAILAAEPIAVTRTGTRIDAAAVAPASTSAVEEAKFKANVALPGSARVRKVESVMSVSQLMTIERELAAQRLAADLELLGAKTGLEFDENYVGQQLVLQRALWHKLAVYERNASAELAAVLAEGQAMTEAHTKRALGLMSTLPADSNPVPPLDNRIKRDLKATQD